MLTVIGLPPRSRRFISLAALGARRGEGGKWWAVKGKVAFAMGARRCAAPALCAPLPAGLRWEATCYGATHVLSVPTIGIGDEAETTFFACVAIGRQICEPGGHYASR